VYDHAEGTTLTGSAPGTVFPYDFHREITLDPQDPVVRFRYRVFNRGDTPFPWIWSSHPLLNVQPGSELTLSGVAQVKLDAVHGRDDLSESDVVSWPGAIGGYSDRFTFPETGAWAIKCFGDLTGESTLALTDPRKGERLEMIVRAAEVPQVGVWINCRGWAPVGRQPYYNLGLEPCIGAPDRLDVAVNNWKTAQVLGPGEERTWSVEVRLPA